uniref:RAD52 motif-containing protein 1 n=1 Tax=Sus scrofa TaxID=9823 RepID=A0A4X1UW09_PIG
RGTTPQHSLLTVFSQFGLVYSVRVFPNAVVAGPGFYAIVRFYSARDAHRAQKACDGKQLFQNSPVKVRLGTRRKAVQENALALNSSKCQQVANYYFGFNGWSKRIIKLQDLSDLEERENEDIVAPVEKHSLKFFCALEVVLPSYECRSTGVGMAEEPVDKLEEGPLSLLLKRKRTQKLALQKAMTDAFQKLLIVVLGKTFFFFFFFVFLLFLWAAPTAYGGSQARDQIRAVAAGLRQSHSKAGSQPCLQPTPQLNATLDRQPTEQGQGPNPQPHGS